jgi:hypothetical protein
MALPPAPRRKPLPTLAARRPVRCRSPADFAVTFTINRFQPATVPVQVINVPGDYSGENVLPGAITIEPNPVFAELRPAGPPPKPARSKSQRPKAKKPSAAAPAAPSPFPEPPPAR